MEKSKISFLMTLEIIVKSLMFLYLIFFFADIITHNILVLESYGLSVIAVSCRKIIISLGILFSVFCFFLFPLHNVGKYLETQSVKLINKYKRKCKIDFIFLLIGFIGLACWDRSESIFDIWAIIGYILSFLSFPCIVLISIPNMILRIK